MLNQSGKQKIVIFSGAGVSAESGIQTFRDGDGLWNNFAIADVATPQAWKKDPRLVLKFYNDRRAQIAAAKPNAAHIAIAALQEKFNTVVITQNIDDLHERAGSNQVIHVHGEIVKARSTLDPNWLKQIDYAPINMGDKCHHGSQLRPHIVWFGETVLNYELAYQQVYDADKILVVGTSLSVYPVAGLVEAARSNAQKIIVALELAREPQGYEFLQGNAASLVPRICESWLKQV